MLARVRETDSGYVVILYDSKGEHGRRETKSLKDAFAWQAAGKLPVKDGVKCAVVQGM